VLAKYIKFLIAGLPSFIVAIALNYFLVEFVQIYVSIAYLLVLIVQVTVNFFFVTHYVFDSHNDSHLFVKFYRFFSGIMGVRFVDWCMYTLLVTTFGLYYLYVQIFNVVLFSLVKYKLSEKVIEG